MIAAAVISWRLGRGIEAPATPARRAGLWLALGLIAPACALLAPLGFTALAIAASAIVVSAAIEAARLPGGASLDATREIARRLALGAANPIRVRIASRARMPLHLAIRDRAPWSLQPSRQPGALAISPGRAVTHEYEVFPTLRGAYRFDAVDVVITGFPGLVRRRVTIPLVTETHVYPDVRGASRWALLLHRRHERSLGIKVARKRGKGTEFESLRDYQHDDEFRDISWKASARADKLITQTFQVERSQNVMILVEAGRMMSAQVPDPARPPQAWLTKLDHCIAAALVLAQAAALKEDRVGVLAFADEVKAFLPPKRGRRQLTSIVDSLHDLQPALCEPDFGSAFRQLKLRAKRRSLVALFTDLLDHESARNLAATLPLLTPQHLPLVIAVSDPTVSELAHARAASGADAFAGAVASELIDERRAILRSLRTRGALVLDVAPGELSAAVVNQYLEVKARNLL